MWLERFDGHIKDSPSGYVVGNTLTIADLRLRTLVDSFLRGDVDYIEPSYIEQFPNLIEHYRLVASHPAIEAYYSE